MTTRTKRLFTMRMSEEEHVRLVSVAGYYNLPLAGVVRMLVKRDEDERRRAAPPKKRRA